MQGLVCTSTGLGIGSGGVLWISSIKLQHLLVCITGSVTAFLGWVIIPTIHLRYGAKVELSKQLHTLVNTLAGANDIANLTAVIGTHKSQIKCGFLWESPTRLLDSDSVHRENHNMCSSILKCM